jgi:hypothetical protein
VDAVVHALACCSGFNIAVLVSVELLPEPAAVSMRRS